jgi:hypothetical protein
VHEPIADSPINSTEDRRATQSNLWASVGELGRGVAVLQQASILPADKRTIDCLATKMPVINNDKMAGDIPATNRHITNPDPDVVKKLVRGLPPRVAADLFGWTRELLVPLLDSSIVVDMLSVLIGDLANGKITGALLVQSKACRCFCTDKTKETVFNLRPLGVPTVFWKLMEKLTTKNELDEQAMKQVFPQIQLAIGHAGGPEVAAVLLREQFLNSKEHGLGHITITGDGGNAFNSLSEFGASAALLHYQELDPLRRQYWAARAGGGPLMVMHDRRGNLACAFHTPGVTQGSTTGSIIYCAAQQPVVEQVQKEFPNVTMISIADDTSIHGPVVDAIAAYLRLGELMRKLLNVSLNPAKAKVLFCGNEDAPQAVVEQCEAAGLPRPSNTIKVLGAIISSLHEKYEQFAKDKYVPSIGTTLTLLKHQNIRLQNRMNMIRHCVAARLNYLCRTTPPDLIDESLGELDHILCGSVHDMLDSTEDERINDLVNQQIALPLRLGGMGVRKFKDSTSMVAYVSNIASAARLIVRERTKRAVTTTSTDDAVDVIMSELCCNHGVEPDGKLVPNLVQRATTGLIDYFARSPGAVGSKLQHVLQKQVDQAALARLIQQFDAGVADGDQHKARLKSLQCAETRLIHNIIPRHRKLQVPDDAFRVQSRLRNGLSGDRRLNICSCNTDHNHSANSHVLRCQTNAGGWSKAHEIVLRKAASIARDAGYAVETRDFTQVKEDHHVVPDARLIGEGQCVIVDVSLAVITPADYHTADINSSNPTAKSAVRREAKKFAHYQTMVRNESCVCAPVVFERETLAMGPATLAWVDKVEAFSRGITAKAYQPRFTIKAQLLIAACIGNARMVADALRKDMDRESSRFRDVVVAGHPQVGFAATLRGAEERTVTRRQTGGRTFSSRAGAAA